jgi:hypothetical protein
MSSDCPAASQELNQYSLVWSRPFRKQHRLGRGRAQLFAAAVIFALVSIGCEPSQLGQYRKTCCYGTSFIASIFNNFPLW